MFIPPKCSADADNAVRLHHMTGDPPPAAPPPPLRRAAVAPTEQRILAAATELFLEGGYLATTLEAVARRAQVGARTVYLRFGTKAALFKRVIDVAIVGDTEPVDVLGRDWMQAALTAPTAAERIAASPDVGGPVLEGHAAPFGVGQQGGGAPDQGAPGRAFRRAPGGRRRRAAHRRVLAAGPRGNSPRPRRGL